MATAPDFRAPWRRRLCVLVVGVALTACDLSPLAGAGDSGGRTPVETVTALEIDVDDRPVDLPVQRRHPAPSLR